MNLGGRPPPPAIGAPSGGLTAAPTTPSAPMSAAVLPVNNMQQPGVGPPMFRPGMPMPSPMAPRMATAGQGMPMPYQPPAPQQQLAQALMQRQRF